MNLPTSVMDIVEYDSGDGYSVLTLDGRTVGCRVTEVSLGHAEAIVSGWYMAYSNRQWVIGDFLNQCASRFGEVASQIIPFDSLLLPNAAQTLSNWASVVSQYDLTERLHALSFSHYSETAYLEHGLRSELLGWAVENQASILQLRQEKQRRLNNNPVTDDKAANLQNSPLEVDLSIDEIKRLQGGDFSSLIEMVNQRLLDGKQYRVRIIFEQV